MAPITQETFVWMFRDAEWKNKFLIGSAIALMMMFVPVLGWLGCLVIYGYALIVMRAVMCGETPSLPKWENLGELFLDGLKAALSAIGYFVPGLLLFFCAYGWLFVTIFGSAFITAFTSNGASRSSAGEFGALFVVGELGFFMLFAIGSIVFMICQVLVPPAVGQYARTGKIGAGYRLREIEAILRANAVGFIVTWIVYIGLLFTLSYLISFLYFTIILCCFIPFLMAPLSFYFALMWACLFGMAYREGAAKAGILSSATTSTSPLNSLPSRAIDNPS